MSAIFGSKDIILAFFGSFLSLVFSQGLFPRIITFVYEFARSVIPFGYKSPFGESSRLTKELTAQLHEFEIERAQKLNNLQKAINCNTSVAMTVLFVAITAISFKLVGLPIKNVDIAWGLILTVAFVYISYFVWSYSKNRLFWDEMPAMASSKFNILLSIEAVILVLYSVMVARGIFSYPFFVIGGLLIIYFGVRLHRIPHINVTHRRAKDFHEKEDFYLTDIIKETHIVSAVFLALCALHFWGFPAIKTSAVGLYVGIHPVRSFATIFSIPFIVFAIRFFKVVGIRPISRFIFYVHRPELPKASE